MVNSTLMNKNNKYYQLTNQTTPLTSPLKVKYCSSFLCKFKGLSWRASLPQEEGLLLVQSKDSKLDSSIHMFGMFFDLAIIWINEQNQIVDVKPAYKWRSILFPQQPAKYALEINIERLSEFKKGEIIHLEEINLS